jgi:hypothetical protein
MKLVNISGNGGVVSGGKGSSNSGGSASRSPIEAPNSLISKDYARLIGVISEGQIAGQVSDNILKDIFLDDTPIMNSDGSLNYPYYDLDYRLGTAGQSKLKGSNRISNTINISTKVTSVGGGIIHTITDPEVDSFVINIATPILQIIDDTNGDINPTSINFTVQVSSAGGSFVTVFSDGFYGKSSGTYSRDYEFGLPGSAPWSVKLIRTTADSTSNKLQNDLYFNRGTEVKYNNNTYANRAVFYASFDAERFSNVPTVTALLKGLIIKVPHNYNPITRTYTGFFSGALVDAWCNNPAWVLYDILTNTRYGMSIPASQVDVFSLYNLAQYCDELVSNGLGGLEPRYVFNAYINSKTEAFKLINSICSACRSKLYMEGGLITFVPDKPRSISSFVSRSNVVVGEDEVPFKYSTSPATERMTIVNVTWFNPANKYKAETENVFVQDLIDIYGEQSTDVTVMGCTSRSQAVRYARWLIYTTCFQTKTVEFDVSYEGLTMAPSDVISINDELHTKVRLAGRLANSTSSVLNFDSPLNTSIGTIYIVRCVDSSGNIMNSTAVGVGQTTSLTLQTPLSSTPQTNSPFSLTTNIIGQSYQVISIKEKENKVFTVNAIIYDETKWQKIETYSLSTPNTFFNIDNVSAPVNLITNERLVNINNLYVRVDLNLVWSQPLTSVGLYAYEVGYKLASNANYTTLTTTANEYLLTNVEPGLYDIRVRSLSKFGNPSGYTASQVQVIGLLNPPNNITNFTIDSNTQQTVTLSWDKSPDIDVVIGGLIEIRHNVRTTLVGWEDSILLGVYSGNTTSATVPLLQGTYVIRAKDSIGLYSPEFASVNTNFIKIQSLNILLTSSQQPAFNGYRNYLSYDDTLLGLILADTSKYDDDIDPFDNDTDPFDLDASGYATPEGYYYFNNNVISLSSIYSVNIRMSLKAVAFNQLDIFDNDTDPFDSSEPYDGAIGESSVIPQISVSNDNITWSDWQTFINGNFYCRYIKFRVKFASLSLGSNIALQEADLTIDVQDVVQTGTGTTSSSGAVTITFPNSFYVAPQYNDISFAGQATGYTYTITNITKTGFDVSIFNSSGVRVVSPFNWISKGY